VTSLFSLANEKMDRNTEDRFTWRLFLCVMQFLLARQGVQAFLYPHPVISTELCFAVFLIAFFTLVMEMNQTPDGHWFIVQASTEDRQGHWTITLEQECFMRSNQEWSRIEAQAQARLDRPATLAELLERYHLDHSDPFLAVNPLTGMQDPLPRYATWLSPTESHVLDNDGIPLTVGSRPGEIPLAFHPNSGILSPMGWVK